MRLRRVCSTDEAFQNQCDKLSSNFLKRGYPANVVNEAREEVSNTPRSEVLAYRGKTKTDRVPFVITHNPNNPPLRNILTSNLPILHSSDRMKRCVPEAPIVGERNCTSLRNMLMPSTLPPAPLPTGTTPGCCKCTNDRCVICKIHLVETRTFASSRTGELFTIREHFSCQSCNIIYLLFCQKCPHTQYVGQTKNALKTRFYTHRSDINKNSGNKKTLVTQHFNLPDHCIEDMRCVVLERVFGGTVEARLARESFWINKLVTTTPQGLNTVIL